MADRIRYAPVWLGTIGAIFIVSAIWLFAQTPFMKMLITDVPVGRVMDSARAAYEKSEFGRYNFKRKIRVGLDNVLVAALQKHNAPELGAQLPLITATFSWEGEVESSDGKEEKLEYAVFYDLHGRYLGFKKSVRKGQAQANVTLEKAIDSAHRFLVESGVDTAGLTITRKEVAEGQKQTINLTFSSPMPEVPDIRREYEFSIAGGQIHEYRVDYSVVEQEGASSRIDDILKIGLLSLLILAWIVIAILAVIEFIRKLRRDEADLRRAVAVGIAGFVFFAVQVSVGVWGDWGEMLVGALVGGFFLGIFVLVLYALAESVHREFWPQKLGTLDALFLRRLNTRELGQAILLGLFFAGAGLFLYSLLLLITDAATPAAIAYEETNLRYIFQPAYILKVFADSALNVLFGGMAFFGFAVAYLRSKINRERLFLPAAIVLITVVGQLFVPLRPSYWAALACVPIAALWAVASKKHDLLTILLAFGLMLFYRDLVFLPVMSQGISSPQSFFIGLPLIFLLLAGAWVYVRGTSLADMETYVPEYVSRIAERERFLKELEIARSVQMKFLPQHTPDIPGLEIESYCRPAMEVGGDYFDFITAGTEHLGVVIGDVSGKGVSAAFYMTMAKGIFHTVARRAGTPKEILRELNGVFYENAAKQVFISVIYGAFDLRTRTLRFARAGHNPLLVRKREGEKAELFNPKGMAIGLAADEVFQQNLDEQAIQFDAGDVFVFYTDGLSESMNEQGEEYGEERLSSLIQQHAHRGVKELKRIIIEDIQIFSGQAQQHDDFTMVIVKVV